MIVQTADKSQKTTKLDRIGKRARLAPDTVFNNIGYALDIELLRKCYLQLDGNKAVGSDGVTKASYGLKLEDNLQSLLQRIRNNAYKPQASRLVEIPKEDGSKRPLAISCLEDKIVQMAVALILSIIYEPIFFPCSFGYREGMSCHNALRALTKYSYQIMNGAIVEIDLSKYFNSIPHKNLMEVLKEKITDKRFLKLIEKLLRAPTLVNGKPEINKIGTVQGSSASAIIANIYLHKVIDEWFYSIKDNFAGSAQEVRFADDMVWVFQFKEDADRFYKVLPKRLEKFGLKLNAEKSHVIKAGRIIARKERLPTYKFLGFTCYWGRGRNGQYRLMYKSRSDRFQEKLKGLRKFLRENLNQNTETIILRVKKIVAGWVNYHAISDNQPKVRSFIKQSKLTLLKWINRKGGKRKMNWKTLMLMLERLNYPNDFKITSMFTTC